MDYVCKVVGNLQLKEINLDLAYLEIVALSSEDFKASPRLREALRNKEIEPYNPVLHKNAKKLKNRNNIKEIIKEIPNTPINIKNILEDITCKINSLTNKIDLLISKDNDRVALNDLDKKLENFIKDVKKEDKLEIILRKLDNISFKEYSLEKSKPEIKTVFEEDVPVYVPQLDISDVSSKNIQSEEKTMDGTEDILKQLKILKGDKV